MLIERIQVSARISGYLSDFSDMLYDFPSPTAAHFWYEMCICVSQ